MARKKKESQTEELMNTENVPTVSNEVLLEDINSEIDRARLELEKTKREIEEKKVQLKNIARDVTPQEVAISQKQVTMSNEKESLKEKIARQKEFDSVPVTGKFINRRAPGNSVKLTYMKYHDDPVKWWTFQDGKTYTIPRGFADQINEYYHRPQFIQKEGEMNPDMPNSAISEVDRSNKIYAFVPTSF